LESSGLIRISELLDDEEEVLLALADSVPTLIDFVGGPASYYVLLEPLEKLTQAEQVAIREKVHLIFAKSIECKFYRQSKVFGRCWSTLISKKTKSSLLV